MHMTSKMLSNNVAGASFCTLLLISRAVRRGLMLAVQCCKQEAGEVNKDMLQVGKLHLKLPLLGHTYSLATSPSGLCVLSLHTQTPIVSQTSVIPACKICLSAHRQQEVT